VTVCVSSTQQTMVRMDCLPQSCGRLIQWTKPSLNI
jgi:hypothetical protein